jgi:uncharacterized protein with NRDE domain
MCLALIAHRMHPRFPLVLAANRDEFHARPAAALHRWTEGAPLLAGRDLEAGGAWCGVDRRGRLALVTNYRDPSLPRPQGSSRGELIPEFLRGERGALEFVRDVAARAARYAGFSLLVRDETGLGYVVSHPEPEALLLPPGIYGLSNLRLDTPGPKLLKSRAALAAEMAEREPRTGQLFALLSDRSQPDDGDLPDTGIGLASERLLSSAFIVSPAYGTRCCTVVIAGPGDRIAVEERRHATDGGVSGRTRIVFHAAPSR